ncbi:helix-turn-helix domain-containing protein [Alkalihalophilus lindianensis]|uniref:Helix-turn-helix domain-containing protein n=1 Tax=Alkalihalophilus lindianensis TaxID=1630542 RepID=A0ABU3X7B5_9BACI|nr:helix-turn-helix domain-containing protein [Alkalihalophilus lindianensis]MDV2683785.1 helix-turn-helix domain-containing protein [Alkalihalophilus lindianensis]MDV2683851.1 helix-turn-helix domain-containing protein [Alkalihalophilus lindianensis]
MMNKLEHMLKEEGRKKGWLAKKVGISNSTLTNIIKGGLPTLPVALKIAHIMNTSVEELWGCSIEEWKHSIEEERR